MLGLVKRNGLRVIIGLIGLLSMSALLVADPCDFRHDPEGFVSLPAAWEWEPPAAGLPAAHARWHGAWAGSWADELKYMLVVERVAADGTAQVVYAIADSVAFNAYRNWNRQAAKIDGDRLVFERFGATISYEFDSGDRLLGTFRTKPGRANRSVMARISQDQLTAHAKGACMDWPQAGERVRIPHLIAKSPDDARPITLEARLYRPKGGGPAPLAIINHGSDVGKDLLKSHSYLDEALWLREKGFAVLVPMRRGRGQSDGVYGEDTYVHDRTGTITDLSRGVEEAVEDLESAIVHGRTLDFIKPGPVLLVGQSRGGFLSVVYAGRKPETVLGVVSFVGGWLAGPLVERVLPYFEAAGSGAGKRVPQLWLHADKDSFYNEERVRAQHAAFVRGGGEARFEFFRDVPGNGHYLKSFPEKWRPAADAFLAGLSGR
jgi:dienelactone hydrolase